MAMIKVSEATLKKVKKIAKKQKVNNGEFVDLAADFFIKTDLDLDADYSIKKAIVENNKRLNQVIETIKNHEKYSSYPIMKEIEKNNKLTEEYLKRMPPERIEKSFKQVATAFENLSKEIKLNREGL
jgi:F0F1-type ATP synthase alpha subunit